MFISYYIVLIFLYVFVYNLFDIHCNVLYVLMFFMFKYKKKFDFIYTPKEVKKMIYGEFKPLALSKFQVW